MAKRLHSYAIAIGSNQSRARKLSPHRLVEKAIARFSRKSFKLIAASAIRATAPLGPSRRRYANAVVLVKTELEPDALLAKLQKMENKAGRKRHRAWGARTLDLDIILWSGGMWADNDLVVPHPSFRSRSFVLEPLAQIAPHWRDPVSGLSMRHLAARWKKPRGKRKAG